VVIGIQLAAGFIIRVDIRK